MDDVLGDFSATELKKTDAVPITIWLPKEYKIRYDKLQQKSSRRFCKKLRELFMMAIDKTEAKA